MTNLALKTPFDRVTFLAYLRGALRGRHCRVFQHK